MKNKRFVFACFTVLCVSIVTVLQGFDPDTYKFIILSVVGGFLGFQSWTDVKKVKGGEDVQS